MQTNEETEIRFYIIGPPSVGKKSLRKKIQSLPCSQSLLHKSPSPFHGRRQSINQEDRSYLIQKYDIVSHPIFLRSFIIPEAEPIDEDYDPEEDDSDAEIASEYKIIFKSTKKVIKSSILLPSYSGSNSQIKHVFLFMHDMNNTASFDQLRIYYNRLSQHLQFQNQSGDSDYIKIFLGNKCEKKIVLDAKMKKDNEEFLSSNSLTSYEISLKLWFNFNDFFIKMLTLILKDSVHSEQLMHKLTEIITSKQSFPKAERKWFEIEESPGPGDYYSNLYRYESKKEMFDCFVNKKTRYHTKIFANKLGIVFNKEDKTKKKKKDDKEKDNEEGLIVPSSPKIKSKGKAKMKGNGKGMANTDSNKQYLLNPIGYSLGLKPGKLNLRRNRNEKSRERSAELRRSFEENVSELSNNPNKRINNEAYFNSISNRKKDYYNFIITNRKDRLDSYSKLQITNTARIKSEQAKEIRNIINNSKEELGQEYIKQRYKDIIYGQNSINLRKSENIAQSLHRLKANEPGTKMYDIRTDLFNPHKGKSITGKPHIPKIRNNITPQFVYLKTDFEIIADKTNNKKPSYGERFKPPVMISYDDGAAIKEKWKKWEENKIDNGRYQAYLDYQEYRKISKMNQDANYREKKNEERERNEAIMEKSLKFNSDGELIPYNDILYTQVEENSPSYSLKGKGKSVFDNKSNTERNNILKQSKTSVTNQLLNPSLAYVKPGTIGYKFDKAERFGIVNMTEETQDPNKESVLFADGIFNPVDHIDFSSKSPYELKDQRRQFKYNNTPGPDKYTLPSFLDKYTKLPLVTTIRKES